MHVAICTGTHAVSSFVFYSHVTAKGKVAYDAHDDREGIVNPITVHDDPTVDPIVSRNITVAIYVAVYNYNEPLIID